MQKYVDAYYREDLEVLEELEDLEEIADEVLDFEFSENIEFYKFLAKRNFPFNWYHLSWAIHKNNILIIDYLLDNFPACIDDSDDIKNCGDGLALDLIKNLEMADYLIGRGSELNKSYMLRLASYNNNIEALEWLKKNNALEFANLQELLELTEYENAVAAAKWLVDNLGRN